MTIFYCFYKNYFCLFRRYWHSRWINWFCWKTGQLLLLTSSSYHTTLEYLQLDLDISDLIPVSRLCLLLLYLYETTKYRSIMAKFGIFYLSLIGVSTLFYENLKLNSSFKCFLLFWMKLARFWWIESTFTLFYAYFILFLFRSLVNYNLISWHYENINTNFFKPKPNIRILDLWIGNFLGQKLKIYFNNLGANYKLYYYYVEHLIDKLKTCISCRKFT